MIFSLYWWQIILVSLSSVRTYTGAHRPGGTGGDPTSRLSSRPPLATITLRPPALPGHSWRRGSSTRLFRGLGMLRINDRIAIPLDGIPLGCFPGRGGRAVRMSTRSTPRSCSAGIPGRARASPGRPRPALRSLASQLDPRWRGARHLATHPRPVPEHLRLPGQASRLGPRRRRPLKIRRSTPADRCLATQPRRGKSGGRHQTPPPQARTGMTRPVSLIPVLCPLGRIRHGRLLALSAEDHQAVLRNYDAIKMQRLAELVTELFLAEGKSRDRLWKQVGECLAKLGIPGVPDRALVAEAATPLCWRTFSKNWKAKADVACWVQAKLMLKGMEFSSLPLRLIRSNASGFQQKSDRSPSRPRSRRRPCTAGRRVS